MDHFTPNQKLGISSMLGYMRDAALPMRGPGYEEPDYWSRPINQSNVRLIPNNTQWQILQEVKSIDEYNSVLREYVASPVYLPYPSNLQFRLRADSTILDMDIDVGIDRHHEGGGNNFPLVRQKLQYILIDCDKFYLEVLNQSGASVYIASALYGWHYYNPVGELSDSNQPQVNAGAPAALTGDIDAGALEFFDA